MTDQGRGYGATPWDAADPEHGDGHPYGAPAGPYRPQQPPPPGWSGAPGYGGPDYGSSGYGGPGYDGPGYDGPGYEAPGYEAPGYGAPGYGADPRQGGPYAQPVQQQDYPQPGPGYPGQPHPQTGYPQQPYPGPGYGRQPFPQQPHPQQPYGGPQQQPFPQQPYGRPGPPPQGYPPYPQQPGQPGQQQPYQPGQQQPGQPVPPQRQQPYGGPPQPEQQDDETDWAAEAAAWEGGADPDAAEEGEDGGHEQSVDDRGEEDGERQLETLLGEEEAGRGAERRREKRAKKSGKRNGCACLLVSLVLLGGVGSGAWYGYDFYRSHFGPPPDYAGTGSGSVQVTIPDGATGWTMADVLYQAGVIKSAKAFVDEYNKNAKASTIQPGLYTLQLRMSAASALQLLISANGGETLIIPEGLRATAIYALIDRKLGLGKGTTAAVAKQDSGKLGLPSYAHGDIEGFLWPARYSIAKGEKPLDLLKQMVSNAVQEYQVLQVDAGAAGVKLTSGYQVVIEASIVEAEGNNSEDYAKIARVLYNRLNGTATQGKLQLDTTLQYYLGRTNFTNAEKNTLSAGGYNTYLNKGLPPGPISNPGADAIKAVLNPTPGAWVYFIAVTPTDTRFDVTFDQFKKDVKDYCTLHHQGFNATAAQCE